MKAFIEKYTLGVVLLGIAILIATGSFFSAKPWVVVLQLAGVAITVSARITFRNHDFKVTAYPGSSGLVESGPYRVIRHPMYAGVLLLIWVSIFGHLTWLNVVVGVIATVFALVRVEIEEQLLRERYPEYGEYSQRTKRLIPFVY